MNIPLLVTLTSAHSLAAIFGGLAVIAIIVWMLRGRVTSFLAQWGKAKLAIKAEKPTGPEPGIDASGITSKKGSIDVESHTGDRIKARDFTAEKDIRISQNQPGPKP